MSDDTADPLAARLDALRRTFDEAWSLPARTPPEVVDLLLVQAGTTPLALRSSEVVGVQALTSLTPLPTHVPSLLGLTSSRGAIVPVYSASMQLGEARPKAPPRWLVLVKSGSARARHGLVGFAFELLHGRVSAEPTAIEPHPDGRGRYGLLRHEARVVHVLDLTTLTRLVTTRTTEEP